MSDNIPDQLSQNASEKGDKAEASPEKALPVPVQNEDRQVAKAGGGALQTKEQGAVANRQTNPKKKQANRPVQKVAGPARRRRRHTMLALALLIWVVVPFSAVVWYLYTIAHDQYASYVGFTVRTEEVSSGIEILGGITELSGSSSTDSDILYKFISSRQMVEVVDAELDLESIYVNPEDPFFGMTENSTIEQKLAYWQRVVSVYYDTRSELIELRVVAFDAQSAQNVAEAIVRESTRIINELTAIAREDTTRYAQEELDRTIERLKHARQAINTFRARTQIVDPLADTQGRLGLVNNLQTQLASALIELDMVRQTARTGDPRITQGERRVQVIEERIAAERNRFGSVSETEDDTYSKLIGEYEELAVDLEFANRSYLSALATYDAALAEAQRKSRYLAAYVNPTLAQSAEYPQRFLISALTLGALLGSFMILAFAYYSLRDRR